MVYQVLTGDDGSADLDICQKERRIVRIVVNRIDEKKPQPDSRHDRHAGSEFFISKERRGNEL